jgi:lipopolysaccharide/colanic/teichoic acid biosynthesis glycosyltransferase
MAVKGFRALFESEMGAITYPEAAIRLSRRTEMPRAPREYALKRAMDFALASVGLLVAAPIWLAISVAIKLEDGGPVFYVQNRWGRHKRPFKVYKFRSMVPDAAAKFGAIQAREDDPRFTRVGRLLRATSLDELPQLVNIWRGQMSWVGPRALPINERQVKDRDEVPDDAIEGFDVRCSVRPGLTGIAQIFAPRDVPRRHKFRYDRFYIERQSLWLDAKLILLSCWISAKFRWEERARKVHGRRGLR